MDKIKKGDHMQIEGFVTFNKKKNGKINLYRAVKMDQKCKCEK